MAYEAFPSMEGRSRNLCYPLPTTSESTIIRSWSMTKRGRKSASSRLSIVPPIPEPPPEPPASLSPEAAAIWREIVGSIHHSQFTGALFLLESYCRMVAFEREFARDAEELPAGPRRDEAGKSLRACAHLAANLATKLRLSPRTRLDRRISLKTIPSGRRPWEMPEREPPDDAS